MKFLVKSTGKVDHNFVGEAEWHQLYGQVHLCFVPLAVNLINVLRAHFLYEILKKGAQSLSYEKRALKMLMKLTLGL